MELRYTVVEIRGDYAVLRGADGTEKETAMFLLPEGVTDGSCLLQKDFEYLLL